MWQECAEMFSGNSGSGTQSPGVPFPGQNALFSGEKKLEKNSPFWRGEAGELNFLANIFLFDFVNT